MKEILKRGVLIYLLLFISTVSFRSGSTKTFAYKISNYFTPFYDLVISIIFPNSERVSNVISDSTGMYIHVLFLGIIALFIAWNWKLLIPSAIQNLRITLDSILSIYISFVLLFYGFNKFFQWQFEFPNSNLLFRRLGDLPKDLLFWSTMGTSKIYNICTGGLEIVAGIFLLINRLRLMGYILAIGIFLQIIIINISFDISVKLFSTMLVLFSALGLLNRAQIVSFDFKVFIKKSQSKSLLAKYTNTGFNKFFKGAISIVLLSFLLAPYIKANFITADNSQRYPNEGAYYLSRNETNVFKDAIRMFIYEDKSLALENKLGEFTTFPMEIDYRKGTLLISDLKQDITLSYISKNDIVETIIHLGDTIQLEYLDTSNFRLRKDSFHWTMDQ